MNEPLRNSTHARHYAAPPQIVDPDGSRHWVTRAANFVVVVSDVKEGAELGRSEQSDEYMLLMPPGGGVSISAGNQTVASDGYSLSILPPGDSRIEVTKPGTVVRILSNKAGDLLSRAVNADIYADSAPEVAPLVPWPAPHDGFHIRHYSLERYASPDPSPLKMRVFRSTNLMVNIFMPWVVRRDEAKLSPHSHDDFEQASLALQGSFAHHLRYPWSPDKSTWRADEHVQFDSPSVLIIPARVIHTTQDVGEDTTWLIDIFSPPRHDFSSKPGFVLNADEYPIPLNV